MLQSTHGALCQVHDKMWVSSALVAIFIYIIESAGTWYVQDIHVETKNQVLYSWISCEKYIIACHLICWTSTYIYVSFSCNLLTHFCSICLLVINFKICIIFWFMKGFKNSLQEMKIWESSIISFSSLINREILY